MARPLDENKSLTILRSAIRSFGELGYAGSSVKDIAADASLSAGTVYTYFADKEALFVAAVNLVWEDFFDGMHRIFETPAPARDKLSALSAMGMEMLDRLYPLARGMYEQANRLDLVHHQLNRLTDELLAFLDRNPGARTRTGLDWSLARYQFKIWLSGILFTLATVPKSDQPAEISNLEACLRQAFTQYFTSGEFE